MDHIICPVCGHPAKVVGEGKWRYEPIHPHSDTMTHDEGTRRSDAGGSGGDAAAGGADVRVRGGDLWADLEAESRKPGSTMTITKAQYMALREAARLASEDER